MNKEISFNHSGFSKYIKFKYSTTKVSSCEAILTELKKDIEKTLQSVFFNEWGLNINHLIVDWKKEKVKKIEKRNSNNVFSNSEIKGYVYSKTSLLNPKILMLELNLKNYFNVFQNKICLTTILFIKNKTRHKKIPNKKEFFEIEDFKKYYKK